MGTDLSREMMVRTTLFMLSLGPKLKSSGINSGQRVAFDVDFDMKGDKAINVRPL